MWAKLPRGEKIVERLNYGVFTGLKWKFSYLVGVRLFEASTLIKFSQDILYLLGRIWRNRVHMWNIGEQLVGDKPSKFSLSNLGYDGAVPHSRTVWINVTLPFCPLISTLSLFSPQYTLSPAVWTSLLKHKFNQAMSLLKNLSVALSFSRIKHNPLILIYKYVVI